ncbi:dihydrofolate reductase family protein [Nocardia huaxiensis]|uniref:dihydrofolate reductase family protein n=1 Tax=Nocardia huaxiensis TaxID=2755382 RepID=UPI001C6677DA|nr:dihydrofolate reductase family protein [Nocardia huaxiensis]
MRHMSIDGVVAGQNWTGPFRDAQHARFQHGRLRDSRALLLGRASFEELARAWRSADRTDPLTACMDRIPKYVVTRTLERPHWNSIVLDGDVPEQVAKLRAEPGRDLLVHAGDRLVDELLAHDLVDEMQILIHPITLGAGRRHTGMPQGRWQLSATQIFASGTVALEYRPVRIS